MSAGPEGRSENASAATISAHPASASASPVQNEARGRLRKSEPGREADEDGRVVPEQRRVGDGRPQNRRVEERDVERKEGAAQKSEEHGAAIGGLPAAGDAPRHEHRRGDQHAVER